MTALLGAVDTRLAAVGTACYLTSFDTLLPAIGPQDGEQSTPGWLANGLDFPDYVELAAPRPYAIIATESDMFPFAGAQTTEAESRRFYRLFDADSKLAFIHGPGGHGNLRPIFPQILAFFQQALGVTPGPPTAEAPAKETPPASTFQVTETGQVLTSYDHSATVFSLNLNEARNAVPHKLHAVSPEQFRDLIRSVTGVYAFPNSPPPPNTAVGEPDPEHIRHRLTLATAAGIATPVEFYRPPGEAKHPARIILRDSLDTLTPAEIAAYTQSARDGTAIEVVCPRPSPPGSEEIKSPILGPFYLLGLRAELVGKTILGMRLDDVLQAIDFTAAGTTIDPKQITAEASGHLALVLLHAAVLDPRLKHITLTNLPPSYADLLVNPLPKDAPQDILPGVIPNYDIPDLIRALHDRVTVVPAVEPNPVVEHTTPPPSPSL